MILYLKTCGRCFVPISVLWRYLFYLVMDPRFVFEVGSCLPIKMPVLF